MDNRTDRVIAVLLHLAAGLMVFVSAGDDDLLFLWLPATASWIAGLRLWARAKFQVLPPSNLPQIADVQVERLEERMASLQEEVARLREDREFFQNLYPGAVSGRAVREASPLNGS